jgi:hypothetical protein
MTNNIYKYLLFQIKWVTYCDIWFYSEFSNIIFCINIIILSLLSWIYDFWYFILGKVYHSLSTIKFVCLILQIKFGLIYFLKCFNTGNLPSICFWCYVSRCQLTWSSTTRQVNITSFVTSSLTLLSQWCIRLCLSVTPYFSKKNSIL